MKQPCITAFAIAALLAAAPSFAQESTDSNVPPAVAQKQAAEISRGDPARWFQDDTTVAERLRTLRKEIGAGLQENLGACRKLAASERAACTREARAIYQRDMAAAPAMAAAKPVAAN